MLRLLFSVAFLGAVLGTSPAKAQTQTAPLLTSPLETKKLVKKRQVVVLDVRTPEEFGTGHVRGARNLNFRDPNFPTLLAGLDTARTYLLYCASGNRSGKAAVLMREKGFRKLVNAGAFKELKAAGVNTD